MQRLLSDVCDIQYGYAFNSKQFSDTPSNNAMPLVRIRDVQRGYTETFYTGDYDSKYIIRNNDLLIGMDGEFNIARWQAGDALLNQRVCKIVAHENTDEEYLRYCLIRKLKEIERKTSFVTVKHLSAKELNQMVIDSPKLEEQRKIADTLLRTEKVICLYNNYLSLFDKLIKSRFVEVFGDMADSKCKWNKCKLVEVCKDSDDIKCGPFGTQLGKDEYTSSGVAVWEIPQINSNFETHPTHFVTAKKANTLASYSIQPGDIAMSRKGNVGRCAVFPHEFENGIIHSDVLRIRVDDSKIDPEFLMRQLHYSGDIERQIELVSSGAIMAGINVTKLKNILVFVPPKALQKVFVAFVHEVNKSKAVIQKSLDEAQLLFDSLMQEYFG